MCHVHKVKVKLKDLRFCQSFFDFTRGDHFLHFAAYIATAVAGHGFYHLLSNCRAAEASAAEKIIRDGAYGASEVNSFMCIEPFILYTYKRIYEILRKIIIGKYYTVLSGKKLFVVSQCQGLRFITVIRIIVKQLCLFCQRRKRIFGHIRFKIKAVHKPCQSCRKCYNKHCRNYSERYPKLLFVTAFFLLRFFIYVPLFPVHYVLRVFFIFYIYYFINGYK